jgi:type III restriction enzyme
MESGFFDRPILNSPYEYPARHWELDPQGQPTGRIVEAPRTVELITPRPRPKKHRAARAQSILHHDEGQGVPRPRSSTTRRRSSTVRRRVDQWRAIANPGNWGVTPERARLLQHWRHHDFPGLRPFVCQIEAAETAIRLTEVAPDERGPAGSWSTSRTPTGTPIRSRRGSR